ncbi:MAG: hypothetical protein K2L60_09975 [Bacteroides sp.]|nr:hypothetical protein [Bacteroides sp.]
MPDCLVPSILPPVVLERPLVLAGDNRQELKRVLHHYESDSVITMNLIR